MIPFVIKPLSIKRRVVIIGNGAFLSPAAGLRQRHGGSGYDPADWRHE